MQHPTHLQFLIQLVYELEELKAISRNIALRRFMYTNFYRDRLNGIEVGTLQRYLVSNRNKAKNNGPPLSSNLIPSGDTLDL
ncbi:hypothetical protein EVAR_33278_1 [Eumeta japonica]|uniref:Uncharacterized protein n=1 Tax=Eumeta variegata TaxID=151549 RepID=A0A4C1WYL6_EUMVA|nr:hypothetical protein EVAR_33278_1 [Eumeta japonica]